MRSRQIFESCILLYSYITMDAIVIKRDSKTRGKVFHHLADNAASGINDITL